MTPCLLMKPDAFKFKDDLMSQLKVIPPSSSQMRNLRNPRRDFYISDLRQRRPKDGRQRTVLDVEIQPKRMFQLGDEQIIDGEGQRSDCRPSNVSMVMRGRPLKCQVQLREDI